MGQLLDQLLVFLRCSCHFHPGHFGVSGPSERGQQRLGLGGRALPRAHGLAGNGGAGGAKPGSLGGCGACWGGKDVMKEGSAFVLNGFQTSEMV